jgi:hypothetical protein
MHDINLADILLLQFCRKVQHLYGNSSITPNMHMHAHLKDIILDYGPVQEFWCFSFERFNGILGKQLLDTVSTKSGTFELCSKHTRHVLTSEEITSLKSLLLKLNDIPQSAIIDVTSIFFKFSSVGIRGKVFSSAGKKSKPVVAMALWEEDLYGQPPTPLPDPHELNSNIRPVNVHHYAKVIYSVNGVPTHDVLAFVSWIFPHPERYSLGKPTELSVYI